MESNSIKVYAFDQIEFYFVKTEEPRILWKEEQKKSNEVFEKKLTKEASKLSAKDFTAKVLRGEVQNRNEL